MTLTAITAHSVQKRTGSLITSLAILESSYLDMPTGMRAHVLNCDALSSVPRAVQLPCSIQKLAEADAKRISGAGIYNSRTNVEVHRPPSHNKPAVVAAHSRQAAGVERHTPLEV